MEQLAFDRVRCRVVLSVQDISTANEQAEQRQDQITVREKRRSTRRVF
jgi:hypothetical protein